MTTQVLPLRQIVVTPTSGPAVVQTEGATVIVRQPAIQATVQTAAPAVVEYGSRGPSGPPGATGAAGPSGAAYTHEQAVPASTWTISHPLPYRPAVTVVDTLARGVIGAVSYPDDSTVVVEFSAAFSGEAYLS